MPIHIRQLPLNPPVLLVEMVGRWSWEEFHGIAERSKPYEPPASEPAYVIVDYTHSGALPSGSPLGHGRTALRTRTRRDLMVVVAPNFVVRTLVSTLITAAGGETNTQVQVTSTREDAIARIMAAEDARRAENVPTE
jgi:hypothetical protein